MNLILGLPQHTQLGMGVFQDTALLEASPFETGKFGGDAEAGDAMLYDSDDEEEFVQWIRSINNEEAYTLHRASASYNPLAEVIHDLVKRHGIKAMGVQNAIGITPAEYLEENPFADILEKDIINRYILDMIGEVFSKIGRQ
ncbi:predicted protein [Chaetoceros tenuissimus]|uniref:Uncharacterized protein n=1 Tax=Chaetoceros tenuissimus TaxID=426638 RepID=A0AAD3D3S8_9STRA|nr:predicted protein [Chaetoceros tenuissimus]